MKGKVGMPRALVEGSEEEEEELHEYLAGILRGPGRRRIDKDLQHTAFVAFDGVDVKQKYGVLTFSKGDRDQPFGRLGLRRADCLNRRAKAAEKQINNRLGAS